MCIRDSVKPAVRAMSRMHLRGEDHSVSSLTISFAPCRYVGIIFCCLTRSPSVLLAYPARSGDSGPLSCVPTSSCHRAAIFQARPALRAPEPSRAFNRARSPRQVRQRAEMQSFSRPNHSSSQPPASPLAPSHLARAILAPFPVSLQAPANELPFSRPARR